MPSDRKPSLILRVVLRTMVAMVLAAILFGVWRAYECIEAEANLQATTAAIRALEQFVSERKQWPRSWDELNDVSRMGSEMQARVSIDFSADVAAISEQDPINFTAIRPVGICYAYRDHIEYLQETIRRSVVETDNQSD